MVPFVSMRMRAALGLAVMALLSAASQAGASGGRRHVPTKFIKAVEGCWQLWPGERITFRRKSSDGLESRSQFDPEPPEGVEDGRRWREAFFWPEHDALEVACGRRSQHGQRCLLRMVDGKPEVQLWAFNHRHEEHLARTAIAQRCAPDAAVGR